MSVSLLFPAKKQRLSTEYKGTDTSRRIETLFPTGSIHSSTSKAQKHTAKPPSSKGNKHSTKQQPDTVECPPIQISTIDLSSQEHSGLWLVQFSKSAEPVYHSVNVYHPLHCTKQCNVKLIVTSRCAQTIQVRATLPINTTLKNTHNKL